MTKSTQAFPYLIQGSNIVLVIDNKSHTISKTHVTYPLVLEAIKAQDWDTVRDVINPAIAVSRFSLGYVTIVDGTVFWQGEEMHSSLTVRMLQMLQDGFNIDPMVKFMHNLMTNPSKRSVTELYGFLEKNNLPITPDGCFLAFKRVRDNYFDVHSGTMDNSVGKVVEMQRNQVCDDKDLTCSSGLHFCSKDYLMHFGGARIVIVKINPADVVSIPSDYNGAKGRACKYEVVGELEDTSTEGIDNTFSTAVDKRWVSPVPDSFEDEGDPDDYFEEDEYEDDEDGLPVHVPANMPKRDSKGRFLPKV